jgi:hypothetical protein
MKTENILKLIILVFTILVNLLYVCHEVKLGIGEFLWLGLCIGSLYLCSKMNISKISKKLKDFLDKD